MDPERAGVESQFTLRPGITPREARIQILAKMELPPNFPNLAYRMGNQAGKTRIKLATDHDMATALDALATATQHAIKHQPCLIVYNTVSHWPIFVLPTHTHTVPACCS